MIKINIDALKKGRNLNRILWIISVDHEYRKYYGEIDSLMMLLDIKNSGKKSNQ